MSERRKRKPKPVKITPKPKLKERPERDDAADLPGGFAVRR